MISDIEACSAALLAIGAQPIASFSDATAEAAVASELYPRIKRQLTTMVRWKHAQKVFASLTPEVGETPPGWEFAYALPDTAVLRVLSVGAEEDIDGVLFERRGDRVLCDAEEVSMLCLVDTDEADHSPEFDDALIAMLRAAFVIPLTDSTSRYDVLSRQAAEAVQVARAVERQKLREETDQAIPDLISIRG